MARNEIFDSDDGGSARFTGIRTQIERAVETATEDAVINADSEGWASTLADELRIDVPHVDVDAMEAEDLGETMVECTRMAGVSFTTSEWGRTA